LQASKKGGNSPYWPEENSGDFPGFLPPPVEKLAGGAATGGERRRPGENFFPHSPKCLQNGLVFTGPGKKIDSLSGRFFWFPVNERNGMT
jgi:hypothetical protein